MSIIDRISETLNSGDPMVRTWFLVHNNYLPFVATFLYVVFVKRVGPDLMKDRKPFHLRKLMIIYNFGVVFTYTASLLTLIGLVFTDDVVKKICQPTTIREDDYTYWAASAAWFIYILKYIEFSDTVFFVLRKKQHLITNLHVIHHAALPIVGWVFIRTERNGIQFFPGGLNSFIHILMYFYYGLAAMGPKYQKYLWWKELLTKLQMIQFVLIIFFVLVVLPLTGCTTADHSVYLEFIFAVLFLALFYNFYVKTYKQNPAKRSQKVVSPNGLGNPATRDRSSSDEDGRSESAVEDYLKKRCKTF